MSPDASPDVCAKAPLSPRRRRLRWTLAIVCLATLTALVTGGLLYQRLRPKPYRPDERNADITSDLARDLPADAPTPKFADMTRAAGLEAFRTFTGARTSQLPEDMGPGVAWGDFNNDGHEDVFLVSAGGPLGVPAERLAPCELYENVGGGHFRKVEAFPETRIHGMGAAWGDYDGDGWLDLVVTGYNALLLFHNEGGTGRFVRDTRLPDTPGFWSSATWGDFDNDRSLDLYVCGYVKYLENDADREKVSMQISTAVPYTLNPASYAPGLSLLFRNRGDGSFTEVATQLGVTNPQGRGLGALWHDFDDDGWLDLYVANDVSDNVLYRNLAGRFEDISHAAYVADYRSAMGLAVGDWNRDGDDDLFIGHWVGQENALYDNLLADLNRPGGTGTNRTAAPAQGSGLPGASTATNKYALRFMDIADQKGLGQIALQYVSWGTEFVDFDGDGWLDLIVANGNTLERDGPAPKTLKPQEAFLFWNRRGDYFYNLAPLDPSLRQPHVSRGLAVADYDNDGAMDVLISFLGEGVQLLRNQMQTGNWLKVRLRSRNRLDAPLGFGDGSKVIARAGGAVLRRSVSSVSYLSQSSHTLHFGLGPARKVDALEVHWLAGTNQVFMDLDANATWELTEGEPLPKRFAARPPTGGSAPTAASVAAPQDARARVIEFWARQRAAMNAMKVLQDNAAAIPLFRAALALDPSHEDSRYYLGQCLASQGDMPGALEQLAELTRINPHSHRGFQQWGVIRALSATNDATLAAAEASLEKAHALNPEETGALLVLGEVALLRADAAKAEARLAAACRSNPKAVGGLFLRGYMAWKRGDQSQATRLLEDARQALGKDWQPSGTTSEGDVRKKQYVETTPLTRFWQGWDGKPDPGTAFARLADYLSRANARKTAP